MLTITGQLICTRDDTLKIDDLCRRYSSCLRYCMKRLLDGKERNELKRTLSSLFNLNTRYIDDAIMEAKALIASAAEKRENPKKIIFGGKSLQKGLSKKHLSKKEMNKKKVKWKEKRQGRVYSRGDKSKKGNLNLRVIYDDNNYSVRINLGERNWLHVLWKSGHKKLNRLKDVLLLGLKYNVRLKKTDGKYYIHITIDEDLPQVKFSFVQGAIGVDLNAFPAHIAWAEVDAEGNFKSAGDIMTPHLYDSRKRKREHYTWEAVHQLVEIAKKHDKGIVIESLNFDQSKEEKKCKKLNRIHSNFAYSKLKEKIYITAKREGVSVQEVNPAYTTKIGSLKYAPQFNLSGHQGAAVVIARRGLGFHEMIPTSYREDLNKSSQCKPNGGASVHQRKEEASTEERSSKTIWKVLWTVVLTGHSTGDNFSSLKKKLFRGRTSGKRGCEPHGQDPPLGSGSKDKRRYAYGNA